MVTYYGVNAGGNWNVAGTWSLVSAKDESRVAGASAPTTSIDCILDDYSGSVTTAGASNCKSLNCTVNGNYTGTLTMSTNLTVAGDLTLSTTMVYAGSGAGTLIMSAGNNVNLNGKNIPGALYFSGTNTTTLLNDLSATQIWLVTSTTKTISGAYNISCATLKMGGATTGVTLKIPIGQTLRVSTNLYLTGIDALTNTISSSQAGTHAHLIYSGSIANATIFRWTFTDIDATGSAQVIDNWYGGTLTGTTNITNRTSADIGGSVASGGGFIFI